MADLLYDDVLESKVVSFLLKDLKFVDQAMLRITAKSFYRKEYTNLFESIRHAYEKYHCILTKDMLMAFLQKSLASKLDEKQMNEKVELYIGLYDSLVVMHAELNETEFLFLTDELKDLQMKRGLFDVSKDIVDKLKKGERAETVLKKSEELINSVKYSTRTITVTRRHIWESVDERWKNYVERRDHPDKFVGIPFGLQSLDELTNGLQPGEFGLAFARTGRGKSRFMFNYGYYVSKIIKKNVLYATLEMYIEQVERMYDSRDAKISYTKLKKGRLSKDEEEAYKFILSQQKKNRPNFYTVDIPRGCTVSLLESEVEQFERNQGKKVDLLIVDYLNLMRATERFDSTAERLGQTAKELKELARLKKMVAFSAQQANRSAVDAVTIGTEHISLSDQIAPHCDFVSYLEQTPKDKLENTLKDLVVKYRDGANVNLEHYVNWDLNLIEDRVITLKEKKK